MRDITSRYLIRSLKAPIHQASIRSHSGDSVPTIEHRGEPPP